MSKGLIIGLAIAGCVFVLGMIVGIWWVSTSNGEIRLRNQMTAKQEDNKNEFDNMWKKIAQVAQVSEKDRSSLEQLFVRHAAARTSDGGGELMKWVQESVPNVSSDTFTNLQNIITSSRDRYTMRQKEILDLKREHDNVRLTFPSSIVCGGRPEIKVVIVTSERTDKAFGSGKDEDVDLFRDGKLEK
jgi:hypothetical protein